MFIFINECILSHIMGICRRGLGFGRNLAAISLNGFIDFINKVCFKLIGNSPEHPSVFKTNRRSKGAKRSLRTSGGFQNAFLSYSSSFISRLAITLHPTGEMLSAFHLEVAGVC